MPARLRPTAPIAADAILVGDPGRALMLAQELLEQPKMSNHARGLWGYTGPPRGRRADDPGDRDGRAERRGGARRPGRARGAAGGPDRHLRLARRACPRRAADRRRGASPGGVPLARGRGEAVRPTPTLTGARRELLDGTRRRSSSASTPAPAGAPSCRSPAAEAADMQTAAAPRRRRDLGVAVAAVLIVIERSGTEAAARTRSCEAAAKRAGTRPPSAVLST